MIRVLWQAVQIGLTSVRVNAVPMVMLWGMAIAVVTGYFFIPLVPRVLEPLAVWQTECGWVASFLNRFFFCGVLPGVFILTMKSLRSPHPFWVIFAQTMLSGVCGIVSGWMFELHALWFGTGIDLTTILVKTLVYQFGWVVLFFVPVGAVTYFWIGRDFSFRRVKEEWPRHFVRAVLIPNLVANWGVWLPLSLVIHLFPTPLQIQLTGLANAFLSLVLLTLGRRAATSRTVS